MAWRSDFAFLLNRDVPGAVAEMLEAETDIPIRTLYGREFEEWSDERIVAHAREQHCTVLTRDRDYTKLSSGAPRFPYGSHEGIVRLGHQPARRCIEGLRRLMRSPHLHMVRGSICLLRDRSAEVRTSDGLYLLTGDAFELMEQIG